MGREGALPTYRELAAEAAALQSACAAHAAAPTEETLAAAREAWTRVMAPVQRAELLQLGPAGMAVPEVSGGRGLRDQVYVFPINRCFVDVIAEQRTYDDLAALAAQPSFARGMGAIEYELFATTTEHGCDPGAATRVDDAAWAALGPDGIRQRRAQAAHAHARLVREAADALLAAWEPSGGDFAAQLAAAGERSSVYPSTQAALDAIYWALFYLDRGVKDMKLGVPTGISELCGASSCPELIESRWAGRSAAHLVENLVAFQTLFLGAPVGTDAVGFDDLLRAVDQAELATDVELAIAAAVESARALPPVDIASFATHEADLEALHARVRTVATLLKVDVAGVLGLSPPPGAGEDND